MFAERENFTVNDDRAHYENEVTGVYFGFDFTDDSDGETDRGRVPVAFNINYFRPHVFGLEAEPVLTDFVEAFELGVSDPQAATPTRSARRSGTTRRRPITRT